MEYTKGFDLYNPTEEHRLLRQMVRDFVKKEVEPQAEEHDRLERFNIPLFRRLGELGLLGITAPEEYGGAGLDETAAVIVHEELAAADPGFTLSYLAHAILCVNNFSHNADEAQKERVLPKLCSGAWIGGMAMSEPDVGTDVLAMKTTASKKGHEYIINGRKMWITNGTVDDNKTPADGVIVYARTGGTDEKPAISTFFIEKSHPGFSVGQKIMGKTGMRASCTAELVFENCKVPESNRIGKEGESLVHMMRNLEAERITLAAMSLGIARRSIEIMQKYANERTAFGQPLHYFGQIQRYIAQSFAEYKAARAYVYDTAYRMQQNMAKRLDSDGAKLVSATMGKEVADRAMQVLGGYGYVSEYIVERLWRDSKLLEIGGGTIEAHQKNITSDLQKHPEVLLA